MISVNDVHEFCNGTLLFQLSDNEIILHMRALLQCCSCETNEKKGGPQLITTYQVRQLNSSMGVVGGLVFRGLGFQMEPQKVVRFIGIAPIVDLNKTLKIKVHPVDHFGYNNNKPHSAAI